MITKNINNIAEILSEKGKQGLNTALDMIKPPMVAHGLRVAKLNSTHIEIIIPAKFRNKNTQQQIHEGTLATAFVEAVRILWKRNQPEGQLQLEISGFNFQFYRQSSRELRLRIQLSELQRETALRELLKNGNFKQELNAQFFDGDEQLIADAQIKINLALTHVIDWKS